MTCATAGNLTICRGPRPAVRRFVGLCWHRDCGWRQRGVMLAYGWYGDRVLWACGHSASDGYRNRDSPRAMEQNRREVARWWKERRLPSWRSQMRRLLRTT